MESTWVMPVLATNVTTVGATTADKHNTKNNEANNCNNLNERKYKLSLTISLYAEKVNDNNNDPEDGEPKRQDEQETPNSQG